MNKANRKIEVDDATAAALESRAAEQGVSVPELVAALAESASAPVELVESDLAELQRRWDEVNEKSLVGNADVVRGLHTWGTPDFKPWHQR